VIPPPKETNVAQAVRQVFQNDLPFVPTGHAKDRLQQRSVTLQEIKHVLISGRRAPAHDQFNTHDAAGTEINRWSYAFSGRTKEKRKLRVCVSFLEKKDRVLLIVTVCEEV
jgi:hypothetical protein